MQQGSSEFAFELTELAELVCLASSPTRGAAVRILFYGRLAEAIGPELELEVGAGCRIAEVRQRLAAAHPQAAETLACGRARVCIGDALVSEHHRVEPDDTIEFLPPVSGG